MNAEAVSWIRKAAKETTGGNCAFVDDDLRILTHLAKRAVDALGLPPRIPAPRGPNPRPEKPRDAVVVAPQAAPGGAPMRYDFRAAPVRFINTERGLPPIGERILAELSQRPLSTMTLATVLGEKEAIVGQALSVLRYEGKVASEGGLNIRQTVWSVAA